MDAERVFRDHSHAIEHIISVVSRRRRFSAAEQEEFAGIVRACLAENDYALLRMFRGMSSMFTFLAVVIQNLSLDFCRLKWSRGPSMCRS